MVWFLISVRPETGIERNKITRYIEEHNVQTRLLFSGNIIKHPCFDQIRDTDAYRVSGDLSETEFVMNNTFGLVYTRNDRCNDRLHGRNNKGCS